MRTRGIAAAGLAFVLSIGGTSMGRCDHNGPRGSGIVYGQAARPHGGTVYGIPIGRGNTSNVYGKASGGLYGSPASGHGTFGSQHSHGSGLATTDGRSDGASTRRGGGGHGPAGSVANMRVVRSTHNTRRDSHDSHGTHGGRSGSSGPNIFPTVNFGSSAAVGGHAGSHSSAHGGGGSHTPTSTRTGSLVHTHNKPDPLLHNPTIQSPTLH